MTIVVAIVGIVIIVIIIGTRTAITKRMQINSNCRNTKR